MPGPPGRKGESAIITKDHFKEIKGEPGPRGEIGR